MRKPHQRTWNKTAVKAALWALYKRGADLRQKSVAEYDPGLVHAVQRYYGSWPGAFEDNGIPLNYPAKKKWNKKKVVEAIKERKREKKGLWYKEVEREDHGLVGAARGHFGTWQAAVEAAGYDYNRIRMTQAWSERRIKREICLLESRGENLCAGRVKEKHSKLFWAAQLWFGSWKNAVLAAGIDYESHLPHIVWSAEKVISAIRKRASQEKAINSLSVQRDDNKLHQAARLYFGTWTEAVEAAGFDYEKHAPEPGRKWNREKVKEAIRKRYKEGKNLNMKAIREEDMGLMNAGTKHFGNWKSAIEAAGIDYEKITLIPIWTKERVLKNIKQLQASDADLISRKVAAEHGRLFWWAVRFFGGWEKAVRAAGITNYDDYRKIRQWDERKVKMFIRNRLKEGRKINVSAVHQDDGGLVRGASRIFGTWEKAVEAACINYEKHRKKRRWNKDVIVKTIQDRMRQGKAINSEAVKSDNGALYGAANRHFGSWSEAVKAAKKQRKT
ncbi:MAG TPA: hypothetical protein PKH33_10380 [bacterium]|mgnify:CR=1 FL=1|nr:hypothetical protein [bacterium]